MKLKVLLVLVIIFTSTMMFGGDEDLANLIEDKEKHIQNAIGTAMAWFATLFIILVSVGGAIAIYMYTAKQAKQAQESETMSYLYGAITFLALGYVVYAGYGILGQVLVGDDNAIITIMNNNWKEILGLSGTTE